MQNTFIEILQEVIIPISIHMNRATRAMPTFTSHYTASVLEDRQGTKKCWHKIEGGVFESPTCLLATICDIILFFFLLNAYYSTMAYALSRHNLSAVLDYQGTDITDDSRCRQVYKTTQTNIGNEEDRVVMNRVLMTKVLIHCAFESFCTYYNNFHLGRYTWQVCQI